MSLGYSQEQIANFEAVWNAGQSLTAEQIAAVISPYLLLGDDEHLTV